MSIEQYPGSLHNHTDWSNIRLRDSINRIPDLIEYAGELGQRVVAITEHEFVGNWIQVEYAANQVKNKYPNLKVIRGNEIYLCRNGLNQNNFNKETDRYYHFILLAKDLIGAKQIMEISTRAWIRSYKAKGMRRVPTYYQDLFDIIGQNPGHVIGSTACRGGALGTQILRGTSEEKLGIWMNQLKNLFGPGNFYLEMQPSKDKEQILINQTIVTFSKTYDIPYIITTDSHYLKLEDRFVHKAYLNAQNGDREVDDFYAATYMMNTQQLEEFFPYFSKEELVQAYKNIDEIGNQCTDYTLLKDLRIPALPWKQPLISTINEKWFNVIPTLKTFVESDYKGDNLLALHIIGQIENRPDELQNQATYDAVEDNLQKTWESSLVNHTHWSAYFLNLQRIIDVCWDAGTLVGCGRGSGVGFILLYILGITQINPLREDIKTYSFRFLNPSRVSVLDIDTDIEGSKRAAVISKFKEVYGVDKVTNVANYRTETSKLAILTAARGLGIEVDKAQYIASLIPSDRGQLRTLKQCMYGDEENEYPVIKAFVEEMRVYPKLWTVAQKIEGLVCGSGLHAGGVIFVDEPLTESTALMRAPDGTLCTQFELHDCEAASLIKMDLLSVEAMDKMHICLDLLVENNYIPKYPTLRETYERTIGIYELERQSLDMWHMVWNHEIQSLFQMEQQSGIQGIALTKPQSVADLAHLNSIIRLVAQEKGGEMPLNKYARFKANIDLWYQEMEQYGLTVKEQKLLEPIVKGSYGICESQEAFMTLVQIPECGGFDLNFADKLRKSIAKKNPQAYEELTKVYFDTIKEKGLSQPLCSYVWNVLVATSRGYGFNLSHTLAYSLIALQEMNLAFRFPVIFWNCACLISDSGGEEENEEEEIVDIDDIAPIEDICAPIETFNEISDDDEDDEEEDEVKQTTTIKKKVKATNYGKIATAIGKMKSTGVQVSCPDINKSTFTFSPDVKENLIRYGLSGISRINDTLIKTIIANRPYLSLQDFLKRVKVTKPQAVNLIKSGAFDSFGQRESVMREYIITVADCKKRVTLQNLKMLFDFNLIPAEYSLQKKVFFFNRYLKKAKVNGCYGLDETAFNFYAQYFDLDNLVPDTLGSYKFLIRSEQWDAIYETQKDIIRPYVKQHNQELLEEINNRLIQQLWDKYCQGSLSKWEMDSVSYYSHDHELQNVDMNRYNFSDFNRLNPVPDIEYFIEMNRKHIPIYRIHRITGTVLDRNKLKKTVSLLTTSGVVTVKIYSNAFTQYDKQISEKGADGKKHIIEKSMFSRGNKIIISGIREGDFFKAKKYKSSTNHLIEQITQINSDGTIITKQRGED